MTTRAYRNINAILWFVAFLSTVATGYGIGINDVMPSDKQLEIFGGFRDGTLTAFIAILAIASTFGNSILLMRSMERTAKADIHKAELHAAALAGLGGKIDHCHESIGARLDRWSEVRPCVLGLRYGPDDEHKAKHK
jgi:hypothetical protein